MCKWWLDELLQFWNVLKGDMLFVGLWLEWQYFIDLIIKEVLYYKYLFKVCFGIIFWGQVKYGYVFNLD